MSDAFNTFMKDMADFSEDSYRKAKYWKAVWYGMRSGLIIFGILTTTDAVVTIPGLAFAKPYFGLIVALITAFDVYLQPETKYKAHYIANDEYDQLKKTVAFRIGAGTPVQSDDLIKEYAEINKRLRAAL